MSTRKLSAQDRFHTKTSWLDAWHHFSFGGHYDENKVRFGALLVVNDDKIAAHSGFGKHPHSDMEIITIPLSGTLTHEDSTGGRGAISLGHIQVMTAGTGVAHSEYNHGEEEVHSYQIWVLPERRSLTPKYQDASYDKDADGFVTIVSKSLPDTIHIHQDAYISVGHLNEIATSYEIPIYQTEGHGLFITVMEGAVECIIDSETIRLSQGDSIELEKLPHKVSVLGISPESRVLVIQVPMP